MEAGASLYPGVQTPDLSGRLVRLIAAQHDKKPRDPRPGDGWKVTGGLTLSMPALYVIIDELQHQEWGSPRLVGAALPYLLGALSVGLLMLAVGVHRAVR